MNKFIFLSLYLMLPVYLFSQNMLSTFDLAQNEKIQALNSIKYKPSEYTNYNIVYQKLNFSVDPEHRYITGIVTSHFIPVQDNVAAVCFDLNNSLTVKAISYHGQNISFVHKDDILTIQFPAALTKNAVDSVSVFYDGAPEDNGFGSFMTSTHSDSPILWTLSEPYGAMDWWPCKQDLTDKIDSMDVYIVCPQEYTAVSNGVLMSEVSLNGKKYTYWKHRHAIAAYLVAIAVTNYEKLILPVTFTDGQKMSIVNYIYPESQAYANKSIPPIVDIIKLFSDLFITYPFADEKYGHAQFGWGGGMEHQTISFMGNFAHGLMSHELAHQWFGDYITCGSWQDIWLNEGFATYLEGLTCDCGLSPTSWYNWKNGKVSSVTSLAGGSVFCEDTSSVNRIFSSRLSYDKGAMVLHMLRWEIGDSLFFLSMKNYLNNAKLKGNYAKTQDFIETVNSTTKKDYTYFFNNWVYGEGYPMYTLNWKQLDDDYLHIEVKQKTSHSSVSFFKMHIPVKCTGLNYDTTLILYNEQPVQEFIVKMKPKITNIYFDTEKNLVSRGTKINHITYSNDDLLIKLNPSPAVDTLHLTLPNSAQMKNIKVLDTSGQTLLLFPDSTLSDKFEFAVNNLKPGIYFISFTINDTKVVKKFLKQ